MEKKSQQQSGGSGNVNRGKEDGSIDSRETTRNFELGQPGQRYDGQQSEQSNQRSSNASYSIDQGERTSGELRTSGGLGISRSSAGNEQSASGQKVSQGSMPQKPTNVRESSGDKQDKNHDRSGVGFERASQSPMSQSGARVSDFEGSGDRHSRR